MVEARRASCPLAIATLSLSQLVSSAATARQEPSVWRDPSPHRALLIEVAKDVARRVDCFRQIAPAARVVVIERTDHYLFVLNEAQVLREIHSFIQQLGKNSHGEDSTN